MRLEVVLHLVARIELVGCCEVAALHLVEDILCIYEQAFGEIERHLGAGKLLGEHRHVKLIGVEATEVAAPEGLGQSRGQFLERGRSLDI